MITSVLPEKDRAVALADIAIVADELAELTSNLRIQAMAPSPRKLAPTFTSSQLAELCGIDRAKVRYLATRKNSTLPPGTIDSTNKSRVFTLEETRAWIQEVSPIKRSPLLEGQNGPGIVLVIANFKGGVGKTSSTMSLAQGLSLRGRKGLLIDLDPQASLTELCGLYAEKMVAENDTVLPFVEDPENFDLESVVHNTYWDGLDVIPAHPSLFSAEFGIPAKVISDRDFKFWAILRDGINKLRHKYDYIIIDTAPSLSYLTINGLFAADAIIMPLVPESLDFISSVSFWKLYSDLGPYIEKHEKGKKYDFISVFLSKVNNAQSSSASVVRPWAQEAYGDWLSNIEVPESSAMSNGLLALQTVFDISKWEGSNKTLKRVREPFEQYCKWVDDFYSAKWEAA